MGIAGVNIKLSVTIQDIRDALKKNGGIVRQACKSLNISKDTMYDFINEYDLKEYLDQCRKQGDEELLDGSFAALMYNLDRLEKNPKMALDTGKYVIDKIGNRRKWDNKNIDLEDTNKLLIEIAKEIKKSHKPVVEE